MKKKFRFNSCNSKETNTFKKLKFSIFSLNFLKLPFPVASVFFRQNKAKSKSN